LIEAGVFGLTAFVDPDNRELLAEVVPAHNLERALLTAKSQLAATGER
jgi:hypothetical protein